MAHGGRDPTPMQWIYQTRSYGFKIRYTTPAAGKIQWIRDEVLYPGTRVQMSQLRSMVHGLIGEARDELFGKLMVVTDEGGVSSIDWDNTVDQPSETKVGWSFLDDERNKFGAHKEWWLFERLYQEQALREQFLDDDGLLKPGAHGRSNNIEKLVSIAGKQSYLESKKRFELAHSDSLGESFGAREEYKILLEVFEDLYLNSRPCRHAEPRPYHSIPSEDAMLFVRWELDRWLGALDYLLKMKNQLTPESGAVGTMLARVIKTTSNDSAYGHSSDLYRDSYITKSGLQWLGLGFGQTVQDTGMVWLKPSCSTGSAYNSTSRFKARSDFLFPTLS
ncbi:hypothetical protein ACLOAV_004607 [Pseudogymnoascus australis]